MASHTHLILPFFCALVYAVGALLLKRSMEAGQSARRILASCNLAMAACFLPLLIGARIPSVSLPFWVWLSPLACSVLFFLGQVGTFRALRGGDVSVATPVLGTKVVITALLGAIFLPEGMGSHLWLGAFFCTTGVVLVGLQLGHRTGKALRAVGWGLFAATVFSLTDVIVARTAREMGFCLFGPVMMTGMAALSLLSVSRTLEEGSKNLTGDGWMLGGVVLIGLQGVGLYAMIALSGDPVGVNIMYALRGLWSVLLVAWVGRWLGNQEASLPRSVLLLRALGAAFLFGAVWVIFRS